MDQDRKKILTVFDEKTGTIRLAQVRQVIAGVMQLPTDSIDIMVDQKHNLDHQLGLCLEMMKEGTILPFPFKRAVILLQKAKRYDLALDLCRYVSEYCQRAEAMWDGRSAMIWKSTNLEDCVSRIPKLEKLAKLQG